MGWSWEHHGDKVGRKGKRQPRKGDEGIQKKEYGLRKIRESGV